MDIDVLNTWNGMEEAKKLGLAKSIGVSNFDIALLDRLIAGSSTVPAVNQIEVSLLSVVLSCPLLSYLYSS